MGAGEGARKGVPGLSDAPRKLQGGRVTQRVQPEGDLGK